MSGEGIVDIFMLCFLFLKNQEKTLINIIIIDILGLSPYIETQAFEK